MTHALLHTSASAMYPACKYLGHFLVCVWAGRSVSSRWSSLGGMSRLGLDKGLQCPSNRSPESIFPSFNEFKLVKGFHLGWFSLKSDQMLSWKVEEFRNLTMRERKRGITTAHPNPAQGGRGRKVMDINSLFEFLATDRREARGDGRRPGSYLKLMQGGVLSHKAINGGH